jgi:predicted acylesterase/phospholipase RssA
MVQAKPEQTCDIVMKGGITSGVVYPLALVELAKKYRFSSIGGTSAGAIAAAAAAAAEYGRQKEGAGFDRLAKIPQEVGPNLLSQFQPTPLLKALLNIFIGTLKAKSSLGKLGAAATAAIGGYPANALLGALPGIICVVIAAFQAEAGFVAFGVLLALVGLVLALMLRLLKAVKTDLAASDFGICPGIRQADRLPEAFTDWLARLIEEAAGHQDAGRPLTFGDLSNPPNGAERIRLAMMTTSLAEGRPYSLPMDNKRFFFKKSEWEKVFPGHVLKYLTDNCDPFVPEGGQAGEFFYFPDEIRLPLIVGARMSLSFPGLISAVPLWTRDFTLMDEEERKKLRRCLFSDGGLSSNFPIHFFDHLLPNSPTFAISLDDFDPKRNFSDVWLPATEESRSGSQLPILPLDGLGGFLSRLIYSAKDWRDNLQSTLPGYRERIVHVVLKPDEGGLNLTMSPRTIDKLANYGKQAGEQLRDDFDLDEHRWRRFLVSMARMEETLDDVTKAYEQVPGQFGDFLERYSSDPVSYKQSPAELAEMLRRAKVLAELGKSWREDPTIRDGHIPRPRTHLRITPKY